MHERLIYTCDNINYTTHPLVNEFEMASPGAITGIRPTGKVLGRGSYGEVIEVEWCSTICAAKKMHDIFNTVCSAELD